MGVLKVKVGADWLPVSQGFDATPAGLVVAPVTLAANQAVTAAMSTTDITGLTVQWNADPTHTYKTVLQIGAADQTVGAGRQTFYITDAANALKRNSSYDVNLTDDSRGWCFMEAIETGLSGVQTRKGRVQCNGTGTVTLLGAATAPSYAAQMWVEDITTVVPMSAAVATPWTAPTFQNSWTNYATGYAPAGYRRIGDIVYLRGLVKSGSPVNSIIFTLSVGFRPAYHHLFASASNDLYGQARVWSDGTVYVNVGSATWFCLDNISFSVTA